MPMQRNADAMQRQCNTTQPIQPNANAKQRNAPITTRAQRVGGGGEVASSLGGGFKGVAMVIVEAISKGADT